MRFVPERTARTGVLVLAGSSGRVDGARARLLADRGFLAESIQWFGGPGQQPGPWEIPIETFVERIDGLAQECDRVVLVGTSFGAEAALLTGSLDRRVSAVAAFAPTDVVWAGVRPDASQASHWTVADEPMPYVPLADWWRPSTSPPAFRSCYEESYDAAPEGAASATIACELIPEVLLVAGADDQVWPSVAAAERIRARRHAHGLGTTLITSADAGHRTILPGEEPVVAGQTMRRGGSPAADTALGAQAWAALKSLLGE